MGKLKIAWDNWSLTIRENNRLEISLALQRTDGEKLEILTNPTILLTTLKALVNQIEKWIEK